MNLAPIEIALQNCKAALAFGADPFDVPFVKLMVELDCAVHEASGEIDAEWARRRAAGTSRLNRRPLHTPITLDDLA